MGEGSWSMLLPQNNDKEWEQQSHTAGNDSYTQTHTRARASGNHCSNLSNMQSWWLTAPTNIWKDCHQVTRSLCLKNKTWDSILVRFVRSQRKARVHASRGMHEHAAEFLKLKDWEIMSLKRSATQISSEIFVLNQVGAAESCSITNLRRHSLNIMHTFFARPKYSRVSICLRFGWSRSKKQQRCWLFRLGGQQL